MKTISKVGLALSLCLVLLSFRVPEQNQSQKQIYKYTCLLACTTLESNSVDKESFLKLANSPLCGKDSANNSYTIKSFEMVYAERGLYQDSTGLPIIVTDYSNTTCKGDTIPKHWLSDFVERGYKSDTIFFNNIIVIGADKQPHAAKPLKFVIK